MSKGTVFTLGVQAGDKAADAAMSPHYMSLRQLLAAEMSGSYSDDLDEFAPVLRIDGSIWHWDREGVANVRVSKKARHATVDVFVPESVWKGSAAEKIRSYLAEQLQVAFESMLQRSESNKIRVDVQRLKVDLAKVVKRFLA
jgi:hypothetical protein